MNGTNFITIGYNFLRLSINSIEEMNKQGNNTEIFMDGNLSEEDSDLEFNERTKWNDQNIGIPILFNFFHGIELILKGLIINCDGKLEGKGTHELTRLLEKLEKTPNAPSEQLLYHFKDVLKKNGLDNFFQENNETIDSFYILFKYPEQNNGKSIKFHQIRGKEKQGLIRFNTIKLLAEKTKTEIIKWKNSA
jgi:HEPN domain-containing protein|tara:strand:+ start:93 stop:668 length:576 start_codon:yes stop_codon:yes gene_type:complete